MGTETPIGEPRPGSGGPGAEPGGAGRDAVRLRSDAETVRPAGPVREGFVVYRSALGGGEISAERNTEGGAGVLAALRLTGLRIRRRGGNRSALAMIIV
jgi:hypothetical protein